MKLWAAVQEHLSWKLFWSYVIIVLVGGTVLLITARLHAPTAMTHHVERMEAVFGDNPHLEDNLRDSFMSSVNEILSIAVGAATLTALLMSTFVSRRIVEPVKRMQQASCRIAQGDYHERIHVMNRDELGDLAASFNHMAQELEQTEQRRLDLIGNVAHELRTPLSSMQAMMEGLIDGMLPGEPATYVNIQAELGRLQGLVQDLQELSRVEAGHIVLDREPVHIDKLIQSAAARLRPQFDDKSVSLTVMLDSDLPVTIADPDRITQVLVNLLGNALQYTPAGGTVTVRADHTPDTITVTVSDTGIGIAPEHLQHLFERFYRVDKSRSRTGGGNGIGLTIARHLIEAHDGRIWATSPGPGAGSTFTFTLPVTR